MGAPAWAPERVQELTRLASERLSANEMAQRLGCSKNSVIRQCQKRGLKLAAKPGAKPGSKTGARTPVARMPTARKPPEPRVKRTSFNPPDHSPIVRARPPKPEIFADPRCCPS